MSTGGEKAPSRWPFHLKHCAVLALLWGAIFFPQDAFADKYALLIGVSDYPRLDQKYQLAGPDNDVLLMKSVLERLQIKPDNISVLLSRAVAKSGKPTRANIFAKLRALASKVGPEDFVYVHFAGHGSRQPANIQDTEEEDALDEIFLPEDVGNWDDEIGAVKQAITDNEINDLITAIRAKGAFVWAVFDSCHSGTMLRSLGRIKWRKVDPGALGIPGRQRRSVRKSTNQHLKRSLISRKRDDRRQAGGAAGLKTRKGGFVAFYAAQSHELAPELQMPPQSKKTAAHGLFSFSLAEAIMEGQAQENNALTYRQLGQSILQKYVKHGMRATTPLMEGSHLDAPVMGSTIVANARQWPLKIKGSRKRRLYVPAGQLQQIGEGAIFAFLKNVADKDGQALGYAVAKSVDLFGSELEPVAYGDKALLDGADLPRSTYARVIEPAFRFSLTVAKPRVRDSQTDRERRLARVIDAMSKEGNAGHARKNGLSIKWVEAGTAADIHLVFSPSPSIAQTGNATCKRNYLWFLDPTGAMICEGSRANLSFKIGNPSARFEQNARKKLSDQLAAIGKVRNLEQMVGQFKGGRFDKKVDVRLFIKRKGAQTEVLFDPTSSSQLKAGDGIRLEVVNNERAAIDLTILFVDSRYGITKLFPSGGRTNRVAASGRIANIGGRITSDTLGIEGMVVIAAKATPGAPVADFSFLAQKKLRQTVMLRSTGTGKKRQSAVMSALKALFARATFGEEPAGNGTRSVSRGRAKRSPFKSVTVKSLRWTVGQ